MEHPGETGVTSLREGMGTLLWQAVRAKLLRYQTPGGGQHGELPSASQQRCWLAQGLGDGLIVSTQM